MPCYFPLRGYRGINGGISWSPRESFVDFHVQVPCGQCIGCRLERSRQWAMRIMHEASLQLANCFVTLTYDDANLPADGSLVKKHFQDFIKRLRKRYSDRRISYFHCGEYGDDNGRPHYHAILFNIEFPDCVFASTNHRGDRVYSSKILEETWGKGLCWLGSVTFESAGYVARYCLKKVNGQKAEEHYRRVDDDGVLYYLEPEYATMSLKPAIGKLWFERFSKEVVDYDGCVVNGKLGAVPRYYDKLRAEDELKLAKRKRVIAAGKYVHDQSEARLLVKAEVKEAQVNFLRRDKA